MYIYKEELPVTYYVNKYLDMHNMYIDIYSTLVFNFSVCSMYKDIYNCLVQIEIFTVSKYIKNCKICAIFN